MDFAEIPPFIPPDDSDDELDLQEVAAAVTFVHSPPRKRTRTLDPADMDNAVTQAPVLDGPPVRDANYYMSDGSCILLVENTLFNASDSNICFVCLCSTCPSYYPGTPHTPFSRFFVLRRPLLAATEWREACRRPL
jgi:hypothetical protein